MKKMLTLSIQEYHKFLNTIELCFSGTHKTFCTNVKHHLMCAYQVDQDEMSQQLPTVFDFFFTLLANEKSLEHQFKALK